MEDEKYPPIEEYYCKKCKMKFVPDYYPILCPVCSGDNVVPYKLLNIPIRNRNNDPSYLDYLKKHKEDNT